MPEWTVIRIVREEYYVQEAATQEEALDLAESPHTVMVVKETAKKRKEQQFVTNISSALNLPVVSDKSTLYDEIIDSFKMLQTKAVKDVCERVRRELKAASKGEPETWGFVTAFMGMVEKAEKDALAAIPSKG